MNEEEWLLQNKYRKLDEEHFVRGVHLIQRSGKFYKGWIGLSRGITKTKTQVKVLDDIQIYVFADRSPIELHYQLEAFRRRTDFNSEDNSEYVGAGILYKMLMKEGNKIQSCKSLGRS